MESLNILNAHDRPSMLSCKTQTCQACSKAVREYYAGDPDPTPDFCPECKKQEISWDGMVLPAHEIRNGMVICRDIDFHHRNERGGNSRPGLWLESASHGPERSDMKIKFSCQTCGKILFIDPEPFRRAYEGRRECLSCRRKPAPSVEVRWR